MTAYAWVHRKTESRPDGIDVHEPTSKLGCWACTGKPGLRRQCGSAARGRYLTCYSHRKNEDAAQTLKTELAKETP